jgi:hypothetical protein
MARAAMVNCAKLAMPESPREQPPRPQTPFDGIDIRTLIDSQAAKAELCALLDREARNTP